MFKLIVLQNRHLLQLFGYTFGVDLEPSYENQEYQTIAPSLKITVMNYLNPREKLADIAGILATNPNISRVVVIDKNAQNNSHPKIFLIHNVSDFVDATECELSERQRRKLTELLFAAEGAFGGGRRNPIIDLWRFLPHAVNVTISPAPQASSTTMSLPRARSTKWRKRLKIMTEEEIEDAEGEEKELPIEECCCVCKVRLKTVMFDPCQHQVVCDNCAETLMKQEGSGERKCPVCRERIEDLFRPRII